MVDKILIVDDDEEILKMMEYKFKKHFEVQLATNGKVALDLIKLSGMPDIFVVDYMMPVMDGAQLVQEVRRITKHVPIIMLTAKNDPDTVFTMAKIVDDYIVKPFDFSDLFIRILLTLVHSKQIKIEELEKRIKR